MNTKLPALALIALATLVGCTTAGRVAKLPMPDDKYGAGIYAASSVGFSADRNSTLSDIAAKSDLSEAGELYLLEVLRITGGFSADKKAVLLALLSNRAVTDDVRKRVAPTDAQAWITFRGRQRGR